MSGWVYDEWCVSELWSHECVASTLWVFVKCYIIVWCVACSSDQFRCTSVSMSRSPSRRNSCMWCTDCFISLSSPFLFGCSRNMWPSHFILCAWIHRSRLKVVVLADDSSCRVRPAMWDSMYVFAPFITLQVFLSSGQASERVMCMYVVSEYMVSVFSRLWVCRMCECVCVVSECGEWGVYDGEWVVNP